MGGLFGALAGCRFKETLREDAVFSVLSFERDDAVVVACVNSLDLGNRSLATLEAEGAVPPLVLRTTSAHAQILDLMGNAAEQAVSGGTLCLQPGLEPLYLVLEKGSAVSPVP